MAASKSTVQSTIIRDKSDALRDEIDRLQEKLDRYESLPKDEYDNGAVVVFEKKFNKTGIKYTYACVKGAGFWFITGDTNRRTWEGLLDYLYVNVGEGGSVQGYFVSELTAVE